MDSGRRAVPGQHSPDMSLLYSHFINVPSAAHFAPRDGAKAKAQCGSVASSRRRARPKRSQQSHNRRLGRNRWPYVTGPSKAIAGGGPPLAHNPTRLLRNGDAPGGANFPFLARGINGVQAQPPIRMQPASSCVRSTSNVRSHSFGMNP
ncbi:hypothetical protein MTO96_011896 [Rhipicephalus appendiculatus]